MRILFLFLHLSSENSSTDQKQACKKHELYVSFRDLGWQVWKAFLSPGKQNCLDQLKPKSDHTSSWSYSRIPMNATWIGQYIYNIFFHSYCLIYLVKSIIFSCSVHKLITVHKQSERICSCCSANIHRHQIMHFLFFYRLVWIFWGLGLLIRRGKHSLYTAFPNVLSHCHLYSKH